MKLTPFIPGLSMEDFVKALGHHRLKSTPQRIAVHRAMMELGHASADEVVEKIAADGTVSITRASVYNTLTQMVSIGIYSQRLAVGGKMVFDVSKGSHLHLYDTYSGTWKDLEDKELMDTVLARLGRRKFKGYKVDGLDISILCHPSHVKKRIK